MTKKGYKQTAEHIRKRMESRKGWIISEEQKKKQSKAMTGRKISASIIKKRTASCKKTRSAPGYVDPRKDKKISEEHRRKIGIASKKMWADSEYRKKQRKSRLKAQGSFMGRKVNSEAQRKSYAKNPARAENQRLTTLKRYEDPKEREKSAIASREKWKDPEYRTNVIVGLLESHVKNPYINFSEYCDAWRDKEFKSGLRKKYCEICNERHIIGECAFPLHHKDFDKQNCTLKNLVTVCWSCHNTITQIVRWRVKKQGFLDPKELLLKEWAQMKENGSVYVEQGI